MASQAFNAPVKDVDVYPSNGKLVVGLQFDNPPAGLDATIGRMDLYDRALKPDTAGTSLVLDSAQIVSDKLGRKRV